MEGGLHKAASITNLFISRVQLKTTIYLTPLPSAVVGGGVVCVGCWVGCVCGVRWECGVVVCVESLSVVWRVWRV